jgi:uncharacterized protein
MAALVDTRMPGVYTVEVPTLPPSIALVPSAVPCFIGYTEKAEKEGDDVTLIPTRIRNMRDYEAWFGTSPNQNIEVELRAIIDDNDPANLITIRTDIKISSIGTFEYRMHYAMQLYFINGGGPCFIISVGTQSASISNTDLQNGVEAAKLAKNITILLFPDAAKNLDKDEYYGTLSSAALKHCLKMGNRVTLFDVDDKYDENSTITSEFRTPMPASIDEKKYGIAYYPFLSTTLDYKFEDTTVKIKSHDAFNNALLAKEKLFVKATAEKSALAEIKTFVDANVAKPIADLKTDLEDDMTTKAFKIPKEVTAAFAKSGATSATVKTDVDKIVTDANKVLTDFPADQNTLETKLTTATPNYFISPNFLDTIQGSNNLFYNKIREAIRDLPVPMPPSPAIAGLYVQTDATQGVWQAPANYSLAAVIKPTVAIDDDFHAELNVDATSGKSVNAIRTYEGRGILVFGARTLAGNDLEWRYVSVRRTFCFIEDAIGRAMQSFVFAPNTQDTWIKVKAMISNFLIDIWKAGGLFGNTTNEAFQVNVGLPLTMSDIDILEGKMIVEIKLRVSRPAEFIILRYEHKFQANAS